MTTTNVSYSRDIIKHSATRATGTSKIRLKPEPRIYMTLGTRGRGSRGLGKFHEVLEIHVDKENRVLAGFDMKQDGGLVRTYAAFGELILQKQEEAV